MIRSQEIYTLSITNAIFIVTGDMSLQTISMNLSAGTGQFTGSLVVNGVASTPIVLAVNQPVTLASDTGQPLDGITIDCTAGGTIDIIARQ